MDSTWALHSMRGQRSDLPRRVAFLVRRYPVAFLGGLVLLITCFAALFAQEIAPRDPVLVAPMKRLSGPSLEYTLGTDHLGRDVLSRLLYGARVSLYVGVLTTTIGVVLGSFFGIVSGFVGGRCDIAIQRVMEVVLTFPLLVLALMLVAVLGQASGNVILAISIPLIPRANLVLRSATLAVKGRQFVEASYAIGSGPVHIVKCHILPNVVAPFLITLSAFLGNTIVIEASLSFLGFGIPPPTPSWGKALQESMPYIHAALWLAIFPGLMITLVVLSVNFIGDAVRDATDPRLRGG